MPEYRKVKGRIVEIYGSQALFAKKLGVSEQTITNKLRGKVQFTQEDIFRWCNALDLTKDEVGDYFFAHKLSKS